MSRTRRRRTQPRPAGHRPPVDATLRPALATTRAGGAVRARSGPRRVTGSRAPGTPLVLGLGALLVVAAAVAAFALSGGPDAAASPTPTTAIGPATITGASLPPFTDPAADPAVGQAIPQASGVSFAGAPVRIAVDGRPKVLLFLAHWCPHCQREVPVVQAWLDEGRLPAGVELISIATSIDPRRPNHPPDAWLAREGWAAPVLVDPDDAVADRYGLAAFPYWVAVTADGRVAARLTGELTPAQIDALVGLVAR